MPALSERDTERLLEGVAVLAEMVSLEGVRHQSVQVVHDLIPSLSTTWNEISATGIEVVGVPELDVWPEGPEAFARALAGHPVIAHIRNTNDGRPRAISDFWSIDQFHASQLYQEFYSRLRAEDQLSFTIPTPDILIGIALNRDTPGFSARDRTLANLLRPHILQAYRNAVANERLGILLTMLDSATNERDEGLVVLDQSGAANHQTAAADALWSRWFAGSDGSRLPTPVRDWLHTMESAPNPAPTWPLVFEDGGRRLVVRRLRSLHSTGPSDVLHVSEPVDSERRNRPDPARSVEATGGSHRNGHSW